MSGPGRNAEVHAAVDAAEVESFDGFSSESDGEATVGSVGLPAQRPTARSGHSDAGAAQLARRGAPRPKVPAGEYSAAAGVGKRRSANGALRAHGAMAAAMAGAQAELEAERARVAAVGLGRLLGRRQALALGGGLVRWQLAVARGAAEAARAPEPGELRRKLRIAMATAAEQQRELSTAFAAHRAGAVRAALRAAADLALARALSGWRLGAAAAATAQSTPGVLATPRAAGGDVGSAAELAVAHAALAVAADDRVLVVREYQELQERHEALKARGEEEAAARLAVPPQPGARAGGRAAGEAAASECAGAAREADLARSAERARAELADARAAHARERAALEGAAAHARSARDAALDEGARKAADAQRMAAELSRARAAQAQVQGAVAVAEPAEATAARSRLAEAERALERARADCARVGADADALRKSLAELQARYARLATEREADGAALRASAADELARAGGAAERVRSACARALASELASAEKDAARAGADAARARARAGGLVQGAERARLERPAAAGRRALALGARLAAIDERAALGCLARWRLQAVRARADGLGADNRLLASERAELAARLRDEREALRALSAQLAGARAQADAARDSAARADAALAEVRAQLREAAASLAATQERASRAEEGRAGALRSAVELEDLLARVDADRGALQGELRRERSAIASEASQAGALLVRAAKRAALAEEEVERARAEADRLQRELAAARRRHPPGSGRWAPISAGSPPPPRPAWALPEWVDDLRRLSDEVPFGDGGVHGGAARAREASAEGRRQADFSAELLGLLERVI